MEKTIKKDKKYALNDNLKSISLKLIVVFSTSRPRLRTKSLKSELKLINVQLRLNL